jgi:hypothetical protein
MTGHVFEFTGKLGMSPGCPLEEHGPGLFLQENPKHREAK